MGALTLEIDDGLQSRIEELLAAKVFTDERTMVLTALERLTQRSPIQQAVILAGGKGTRLSPLTKEIPKPLVPIHGKPVMGHVIDLLRLNGIQEIIICAGYKADKIQAAFGDGFSHGVRIRYVIEEEPLGTAGALKLAKPYLTGSFVVTNSDELKDIDLVSMGQFHISSSAPASLALTEVDDPSAYGVVEMEGDRIKRFVEKPEPGEAPSNLVNAGLYILDPELLDRIPDGFSMVEYDLFPKLAAAGELSGFPFKGQWFDTGTFERFETALEHWNGFAKAAQ